MECPHCHRQIAARSKNCPSCGGYIPAGQHLLEEAGIDEPAPRTDTPKAAAWSAASTQPAKLRDRFAAFLLDSAFLFGAFAIVDAWIFMRWGKVEGAELNLTVTVLLLAVLSNALVLFSYGCLLEAAFGATLGKMLVGIRVVRNRYRSALAASAIRNAMRIVDGFGLYLLGAVVACCSRSRQRLGDLCAGTAVVEAEFGIASKLCALLLFLGMVSAVVWALPRICVEQNVREAPFSKHVLVRAGKEANAAYFKIAQIKFDIQIEPASDRATEQARAR